MAKRTQVEPGEPQVGTVTDAGDVIDVGCFLVAARMAAGWVELQEPGTKAIPVGIVASSRAAWALPVDGTLALTLPLRFTLYVVLVP
jgi:hypothetical protein